MGRNRTNQANSVSPASVNRTSKLPQSGMGARRRKVVTERACISLQPSTAALAVVSADHRRALYASRSPPA
jgi:hypothetical protein